MKLLAYLAFLLVGQCHCESYTSCAALPFKQVPQIQDLVNNSPYTISYTTDVNRMCSKSLFTYPKYGSDYYDASFVAIRGNKVTYFKLNINDDVNKEILVATLCTIDAKTVTGPPANQDLQLLDYDFVDGKGSFAIFVGCDGTRIDTFHVLKNSNNFEDRINEAFRTIANVPRKQTILPADSPYCSVDPFNPQIINPKFSNPAFYPGLNIRPIPWIPFTPFKPAPFNMASNMYFMNLFNRFLSWVRGLVQQF